MFQDLNNLLGLPYEIKEGSGVDMAALKAVQKNRFGKRSEKIIFVFCFIYKYIKN